MTTHAREKFAEAVRTLAAGSGNIRERLEQVFFYDLVKLEPNHLPRDLCLVYEAILLQVKGNPAATVDQETIYTNLHHLSNTQCAEIAIDLVDMALDMASRAEQRQPEP